jgi:hypothetical protein
MQDKVIIWLFQQGSKNDHSEPLGLNKSELLKKTRFGSKGQWSSTHSAAPLEHVDVLWADEQGWTGPLCSWAAHQGWTLVLLGHPPGLDPRAPGPPTRARPSCSWAAQQGWTLVLLGRPHGLDPRVLEVVLEAVLAVILEALKAVLEVEVVLEALEGALRASLGGLP